MPIYEFYCAECHTVFSFLSRSVNTRKRPTCPRCGRPRLERRPSRFAVSHGITDRSGEDDLSEVDESRMERAMQTMAAESGSVDESDPRAMARLMERFYEASGMEIGDGMREAVRRMEAGEDPDRIEEEMGDLLEQDDPFFGPGRPLKSFARRARPPRIDETLYEL
jgi:putative FmdB family regulatory protein